MRVICKGSESTVLHNTIEMSVGMEKRIELERRGRDIAEVSMLRRYLCLVSFVLIDFVLSRSRWRCSYVRHGSMWFGAVSVRRPVTFCVNRVVLLFFRDRDIWLINVVFVLSCYSESQAVSVLWTWLHNLDRVEHNLQIKYGAFLLLTFPCMPVGDNGLRCSKSRSKHFSDTFFVNFSDHEIVCFLLVLTSSLSDGVCRCT